MAQVIGQIGALKSLKKELYRRGITRFNSVGQMDRFLSQANGEKKEIRRRKKETLDNEIQELSQRVQEQKQELQLAEKEEVRQLKGLISALQQKLQMYSYKKDSSSGLQRLYFRLRCWHLNRSIKEKENHFDDCLDAQLEIPRQLLAENEKELQKKRQNYELLIEKRAQPEIAIIDYTLKTVHELYPMIAGAKGESQVAKELEKLPADYTVIHDYQLLFKKPLSQPKSRKRIRSVQIDHLVMAPSGIFIIETKNWSSKSIESLRRRSPIEQIQRANFALNTILKRNPLLLFHHWGQRKVPVHNLMAMTGRKPMAAFEAVEMLTVSELSAHIENSKPVLRPRELKRVSQYLLSKSA